MKKNILLPIFLLINLSVLAQIDVTFDKIQDEVNMKTSENVSFEVKISYKSTKNVKIEVSDAGLGDAEMGKDFNFIAGYPFIHEFSSSTSVKSISVILSIPKTASPNKIISLKLIGTSTTGSNDIKIDKNIILIKILDEKKDEDNFNTPKNNYIVSLGSNFDFLNKLELDKLYADTYVFLPKLYEVKRKDTKKKKSFFVGMDAGFYRNRLISKPVMDLADDTVSRRPMEVLRFGNNKDSVLYQQSRFIDKTTISTDNLALYLSPIFLVNPESSQNTQIYAALHAEVIQRVYTQETTIQQVSAIEKKATLKDYENLLTKVYRGGAAGTFRRTKYDAYFGGGIILQHRNKLCEVRLKGLFMVSNVGSTAIYKRDNDGTVIRDDKGIPSVRKLPVSFMVNFMVKEPKSGVKIGGEVRGVASKFESPNILLFIAKEFSIDKIAELVTN